MTTITRRYRFSASHRLHSPALSAAENAQLYGKCNNPFGHGHDYVLEVTVKGKVDAFSGLIVPVPKLDRLVEYEILQLFASRNINSDVPQFASRVATTENVALVIADLLEEHWEAYLGNTGARLYKVHLQETDRNGFEILLAVRENSSTRHQLLETVSIHA
jgi:6-pyruvoyltetrahydropterin/6-carboxytetrahydropterin synthase